MKNNKIVLMALMGSFIGINAVDNGKFKYEYRILDEFGSRFTPFSTGLFIKGASLEYPADSNIRKKLKDAAERGSNYWYLRSKQNHKHFSYTKDGQLPQLNLTKENLDSVLQHVGYMAVDVAVSECSSRIAELELVKNIIQSQPIQYISDNVSERNKKFFKDQAVFVVSAGLVNEAYKIGEKSSAVTSIYNSLSSREPGKKFMMQVSKDTGRYANATLYQGQSGISGALTGSVAINSFDHFIVSKYVSQNISPIVSWGLCNYIVFPIVKSFFDKK